MSEQPSRYNRSFSGMIGAMVVLVLVILGLALLHNVGSADPTNPVQAVDFSTPAKYARRAASFDLLAPRRLPPGWIATSVRFQNGSDQSWHLGCLTDQKRYVGLEQADAPLSSMLQDFVGDNASRGPDVPVAGRTWQSWITPDADRALVRETGKVTTVVVGRVPEATLTTFIDTLR